MIPSILIALSTVSAALAAPAATKSPACFLAGDSTTHTSSGWGDGILNTTLTNGATGHNYGVSGATTASFRADGAWSTVLTAVKNSVSSYSPNVTIQFGHNNPKSALRLTITQFTANLETFASDVKNAGGTSVLLTSLSRRNHEDGFVKDDLADVRNGTIAAAMATGGGVDSSE